MAGRVRCLTGRHLYAVAESVSQLSCVHAGINAACGETGKLGKVVDVVRSCGPCGSAIAGQAAIKANSHAAIRILAWDFIGQLNFSSE